MYKKEKKNWLKHLDFTILDIISLQLAFIVAYVFRLGWSLPYSSEPYERLAVVLFLIDICVVFFFEPYNGILRRGNFQEMHSCITFSTTIFVGLLMYEVATKQTEIYSRKIIFLYWALSMVFVYIGRLGLKYLIRWRMTVGKNLSVMVLVTASQYAKAALEEFAHLPYRDFYISGVVVVDEPMKGKMIYGVPVVANADDFYEYLLTNVVDEVFINGNTIESSQALANELLELGITVHFNLVHMNALAPNKVIEHYGNYMVLTSSMKIASPRQLFIKRLMDIIGSIIGLIACGIAYVIFAPIIKKQSPGPVFFSQTRVGKNGRKFKLYKFRSMTDARNDRGELLPDEMRLTSFGKILRSTSLDELPELFNILKVAAENILFTVPEHFSVFSHYYQCVRN